VDPFYYPEKIYETAHKEREQPVGGATLQTVTSDDSSPLTSPVNEDKATANPVTDEGEQVTTEDEKQETSKQALTSSNDESSSEPTWGAIKPTDHDEDLRAWQQINVRKKNIQGQEEETYLRSTCQHCGIPRL
jgi:hypothetical protein